MSRAPTDRGGPSAIGDRRSLSIADGMIAIAAVAVAMVLVRATLPIDPGSAGRGRLLMTGMMLLANFLAPLSFAIVAIRLRRPRPPFRRLARQPGFAACLAASAACVVVAILLGILRVTSPKDDAVGFWMMASYFIPFAVLGAWVTLAAAGRWRRPAPGGVERLGWLIGWAWLAITGMLGAVVVLG